MDVTMSTSKWNLAEVKARIDAHVRSRVQVVFQGVWFSVVGGDMGADFPYWSGGYVASWRVGQGTPDRSFTLSDITTPGAHKAPVPVAPHVVDAYGKVYVSNSAPHASMVEHTGTPTHLYPWQVAASARNHVMRFY